MRESSYVVVDIWANAVMSILANICKYYNLVQAFQKVKIQDING